MSKDIIETNLKQALEYTDAYLTKQELGVVVELMDRASAYYNYRDYRDIAEALEIDSVIKVLDDYALLPELRVSELEDWFSDHQEAYTDLMETCGVYDYKELTLEDYIEWLGYHDQAYLDYLTWLLQK